MSTYDERSRYRDVPVYQVPDHRGRTVTVVAVPAAPDPPDAGVHLLRPGQRPDHLAAQYLDDPAGYWRIAEANDAMHADWLAEQREITIPVKDA